MSDKINPDKYDPRKVIEALRSGHHIMGPSEAELVGAAMIEKYLLRPRFGPIQWSKSVMDKVLEMGREKR